MLANFELLPRLVTTAVFQVFSTTGPDGSLMEPPSVIVSALSINGLTLFATVIVLLLVNIAPPNEQAKPPENTVLGTTPVPLMAIGLETVIFPLLLTNRAPPVVMGPSVKVATVLPRVTSPVSVAEKLDTAFDANNVGVAAFAETPPVSEVPPIAFVVKVPAVILPPVPSVIDLPALRLTIPLVPAPIVELIRISLMAPVAVADKFPTAVNGEFTVIDPAVSTKVMPPVETKPTVVKFVPIVSGMLSTKLTEIAFPDKVPTLFPGLVSV